MKSTSVIMSSCHPAPFNFMCFLQHLLFSWAFEASAQLSQWICQWVHPLLVKKKSSLWAIHKSKNPVKIYFVEWNRGQRNRQRLEPMGNLAGSNNLWHTIFWSQDGRCERKTQYSSSPIITGSQCHFYVGEIIYLFAYRNDFYVTLQMMFLESLPSMSIVWLQACSFSSQR